MGAAAWAAPVATNPPSMVEMVAAARAVPTIRRTVSGLRAIVDSLVRSPLLPAFDRGTPHVSRSVRMTLVTSTA